MDDIERRRFIKQGLLTGVGVAAGLSEPEASASRAPFDVAAFVERCDSQLEGIRRRRWLGGLLPEAAAPSSAVEQAAAQRAADLLHDSMRSLLLVSMLREVPVEDQRHPAIQERIAALMPEMDRAVYGVSDLMTSLSAADRIDLRDALREDPDLALRVIEAIDDEGVAAGVGAKRRLHFRSVASQVAWRLGHQSTGAVFEEYITRAERLVVARGGQMEQGERALAQIANAALWAGWNPAGPAPQPAPGLADHRAWIAAQGVAAATAQEAPAANVDDPGFAVPPPAPPPTPPVGRAPLPVAPPPQADDPEHPPPPPAHDPERPRPPRAYDPERPLPVRRAEERARVAQADRVVRAGAIMLGLSAALDIGGAVLLSAGSIIGAFLLTPGALLLIAGLITLIVGLVKRARAQQPTQSQPQPQSPPSENGF